LLHHRSQLESKNMRELRVFLALVGAALAAPEETCLVQKRTKDAVMASLASNRSNSSRRFTPGDVLPFDFELDPIEMKNCMTPASPLTPDGTNGDCFSICFFTFWLCEGIFDIADNVCDAYADIGAAGMGAAITAGIAAAIPGVVWDLPIAATIGLLAKEFLEPLFDRIVERICQPSDALGDTISLTDECVDSMKLYEDKLTGIVQKAGTTLNGMLEGNLQDCCSTNMRRRRNLGYCSNVERRRRCLVDWNPTDVDECYNPEDELAELYEEGVTISVQSASDLPDTDTFGQSDPYVICKDEYEEEDDFQTKTVHGAGANPVWTQGGGDGWLSTWEAGEDVHCEIWDEDTGRMDDLMGTFTIPAKVLDGVERLKDDEEINWQSEVKVHGDDGWFPFPLAANQTPDEKKLEVSKSSMSQISEAKKPGTVKGTLRPGGGRRPPNCPTNSNLIRCSAANAWNCNKACDIYRSCVNAHPAHRPETRATTSFGPVKVCRPGVGGSSKNARLTIPEYAIRGVEEIGRDLSTAAKRTQRQKQNALWQVASDNCKHQFTDWFNCCLLINAKGHRTRFVTHIHNKKAVGGNLNLIRQKLVANPINICSRSDWSRAPDFSFVAKYRPMGRPTAGFTVRKKCQKVWAKLLRYADMRDGIFTEAFRGPARAHPDLGKFGLLVIWVKCGTANKRVLLVNDNRCSLEHSLFHGNPMELGPVTMAPR